MTGKREFTFSFEGKDIVVETGKLARQTDGAVWITCGGTQILVTVCSAADADPGKDFFPLLVDYKEKYFAAGKFLGGFRKREGRPTDDEVLLMRMIDRPFRPLFPEGYFNETIIQANVFSYDPEVDPEILAGVGASAALGISNIPFDGPVGFCKVGRIDGKFIINPNGEQLDSSSLELVVAGTKDAVAMIEGEADELSEEEVLEGIMAGHDYVKKLCEFLDHVNSEVGKKKREFAPIVPNKSGAERVEEKFTAAARNCLDISDKIQRRDAIAALESEVAKDMKSSFASYGLEETASFKAEAYQNVDALLYKMMRGDILNEEKRIGGRGVREVRSIATETDFLKKAHGSSLFTRGETQVLAAVTIGGKDGEQMKDGMKGTSFDSFYLHYTFPPFSVGEARGYRGVGRREIGHGNLAERAIRKVLPKFDDFMYTMRVCCEVLESNGSSSMGSICSGSMALMDAGVPLKTPVAGVAMGLVKDGENFKILTDILGDEDHLGDMDFKVAGSEKGITAIQMDIKISGITREIFQAALTQAKEGRLHILDEMSKTITKHREELKEGVPRVEVVKVAPDKIGSFIGPGGKNIKAFQEHFQVTAECMDDGTIKILGTDTEVLLKAAEVVKLQLNGPKINDDYEATVVAIKEYGAFVDIAPNVSGLLHISEVTDGRVKDINEYLDVDDKVTVRVLEIDRFGKIKFSAKAVKPVERKSS